MDILEEKLQKQAHKHTLEMPHATATFNGKVIAEADKWEFVEGNVYVIILSAVDNTPG